MEPPVTRGSTEPSDDDCGPIWDQALDWMLQVAARPADRALLARRDAWIAQHPAHRAAYLRAEQVWALTGTAMRAGRRPRRGGWPLAIAVVAVAACLAVVAMPDLRLRLQADYRTETGEVRDLTLPDGSIVTLDAESAVALADAGRGIDLLEGRAFFQVMPDKTHAFSVGAGEAAVTVLGTAFDVALSDRTVTVAVERGSVSVSAGPAGRTAQLQAGDSVTIDRKGGDIITGRVPPRGIAAWRTGRLIVEDVPVADVIEEIARHHRGLLLLRDAELGARRVTGAFDLSDPEAALHALLQPYGADILRVTPYVLVVQ
jgi:transmembrane sensor